MADPVIPNPGNPGSMVTQSPTPSPTPTPTPTPSPEPTPTPTPEPKPEPKPEPEKNPDGTLKEPEKKEEPKKEEPKAESFAADKLKLPEGLKTDDPIFKDFSTIMTDEKLAPQERGQKLVDLYAGALKKVGEAHTQAWDAVNDQWVKDTKADPEIGGAKFDATKTAIAATIDLLPKDKATAFRQALDVTGAGNHPAFWRGMAHLASLLSEGGHVSGQPSSKPSFEAKSFFPNSKMS